MLRMLVIPFLSFFIAIGTGWFVIKPWISDITQKREVITASQDALATLITKLEVLQTQDASSLKDYLVRLTLAIPPKSSPPLILATVEQAITESGLVVASINFGGVNELSTATVSEINQASDEVDPLNEATVEQASNEEVISGGKIEVQFSSTGEYYQVVQFLKTIQKVNPMILGSDFSITQGSSTTATTTEDGAAATVAGSTFAYSGVAPFQELPTDLGAITTDVQVLSKVELEIIDALDSYTTFFEVKPEVEQIQSYEKGKDNPF